MQVDADSNSKGTHAAGDQAGDEQGGCKLSGSGSTAGQGSSGRSSKSGDMVKSDSVRIDVELVKEEVSGTTTPMKKMKGATQVRPFVCTGCQAFDGAGQWMQGKFKTLCGRPLWFVIGFCMLSMLISLGLWGVIAAADAEAANRRETALSRTREKACDMLTVIQTAFNPAVTLATLVVQQPDWPSMNATFYKVAPSLLALPQSRNIICLQLAPFGIIRSIIPLAGFEKSLNPPLDLLQNEKKRVEFLPTVAAGTLTIGGPSMLYMGIRGFVGRYPVFIDNVDESETFNAPGSAFNCNSSTAVRCYKNETQSKFWGFTKAVIGWSNLKNQVLIYELCNGYDFMMTYTDAGGNPLVPIAGCNDDRSGGGPFGGVGNSSGNLMKDIMPSQPVSYTISVLGNEWTFWTVPKGGASWTPAWKAPLIATVVIVSVLLVVLVLLLAAVSLEQRELLGSQRRLISTVKATNAQLARATTVLEEEKVQKDALLVRQINLIMCLETTVNANKLAVAGRSNSSGISSTKHHDSARNSMEWETLQQIEAIRKQLNNSCGRASEGANAIGRENNGNGYGGVVEEELKILELLGEGSFGKVYKAMWRGAEVAVKQIVLPASMSGAEKRDKMAIMEAAISSSLCHPNVVQTFTYAIRPLLDSQQQAGKEDPGALWVVGELNSRGNSTVGSGTLGTTINAGPHALTQTNAVHFEVRLVLEFCDKGCLRDALDAKVFHSHGGSGYGGNGTLNYRAVLDTALDVANAMTHLHSANVLHSDLKARNIMLKSDTKPGRGVVAKVADFGLSVRLDGGQTHLSSMFQGTMTHMAPEVLMEGRASKAADMYSFGITMWEIVTGGCAFSDIPRAHVGHAVTSSRQRPVFSSDVPEAFRLLIEACWAHHPSRRPTFGEVVERLTRLRSQLGGATEKLPEWAWACDEDRRRMKKGVIPIDAVAADASLIPPAAPEALSFPPSLPPAAGASTVVFSAPPRILHDNEDDYGTGIVLGMPPDVGCGLNSSSMESRSFFSKNPRLEPINETRESLDELPERQASSTTERSGRSSAPQSAL